MTGPTVTEPDKCDKAFQCKGKKLCGYAFPSQPSCECYNSSDEIVRFRDYKSGETTMHRYCNRQNGDVATVRGIIMPELKEEA